MVHVYAINLDTEAISRLKGKLSPVLMLNLKAFLCARQCPYTLLGMLWFCVPLLVVSNVLHKAQ